MGRRHGGRQEEVRRVRAQGRQGEGAGLVG